MIELWSLTKKNELLTNTILLSDFFRKPSCQVTRLCVLIIDFAKIIVFRLHHPFDKWDEM